MTPQDFRLFTVEDEERPPMSQSFICPRAIKMVASFRSHAASYCVQMPTVTLIVALSMLLPALVSGRPAYAQMPAAQAPSPQSTTQPSSEEGSILSATGSEDSEDSEDDRQRSASSSNSATPLTLSAEQIIRILQQNPDLVVELKSQAAERLQQQGTPIDPNEISDQMLYSQIEANADLRANVTTFLRARGYVTQDDLQAASSSGAGGSEGESLRGQQSLLLSGGVGSTTLAPVAGMESEDSFSPEGDISSSSTQTKHSLDSHSGSEQMRGHQTVNASTDLPKVVRRPAPCQPALDARSVRADSRTDCLAEAVWFGSLCEPGPHCYGARGLR